MKQSFVHFLIAFLALFKKAYATLAESMLGFAESLVFRAAGFRRISTSVDGIEIVFRTGGKGQPIVLFHGFAGDKSNWILIARRLAKNNRVLIPDLPGFGSSARKSDVSYDAKSQASRMSQFCHNLNIGRHHVVGHSMGGHIAAIYASNNPDHVLSLTLLANAGIEAPNKSPFFRDLEAGKNPLIPTSASEYDAFLENLFYGPPPIPKFARRAFGRRIISQAAWHQRVFDDMVKGYQPLEEVLSDIKLPVLIIWGRHDRILDVSSVSVMEPLLDQHQSVIFEDCGHIAMLENPLETGRVYTSFLDKISSQRSSDSAQDS